MRVYAAQCGVRSTEEVTVRVCAEQLKAQCGVRSTKEDEVRVYAEQLKVKCRYPQVYIGEVADLF